MTHLSSTTSLLSGSISGPLCRHICKCSKINEMKVNYTFNNIVLTFFKRTIVAFLDISSLKNKNRIWKWQIWLKYFHSLFRKYPWWYWWYFCTFLIVCKLPLLTSVAMWSYWKKYKVLIKSLFLFDNESQLFSLFRLFNYSPI